MKNLHNFKYGALFVLGFILATGCNRTEVPTAWEGVPTDVEKVTKSSGNDCVKPPEGLVSW